ncbi:MAG TPA: hypothetical protein VMX57_05915 [Planctomycetota bacterium]|nr:hypothetical protein [Planctomycetota bacterium]
MTRILRRALLLLATAALALAGALGCWNSRKTEKTGETEAPKMTEKRTPDEAWGEETIDNIRSGGATEPAGVEP